jgi:FHS family L-fucose permease-like MFS transporter
MGFKEVFKNRSGLRVDNRKTTSAATLTLRQSLWPLSLVTILFFLWVCLPIFKETLFDIL